MTKWNELTKQQQITALVDSFRHIIKTQVSNETFDQWNEEDAEFKGDWEDRAEQITLALVYILLTWCS